MRITNFLCADYASQDVSGKITLVGACIDRIEVAAFPARFLFYIFARCVAELNDVPGKKTAVLKLIGDDKVVGTSQFEFDTTETKPNVNIITIVDFQTDKPASFRFELTVEGADQSASWPLEVRQA